MSNSVVSHLRRRLAGWLALRVLLALAAVAGAAALVLVLLDAALQLSERMRAAAPWALAGCVVLVLIAAMLRLRQFTVPRVARVFERAFPALGNRLTNAVQLADPPGVSPIQEFLRVEAVEMGRRAAMSARTWPVVRRSVFRAGLMESAVVLAWAGFIFFAGDVWRAVLPRILDPRGDHPPFSRLHIEVTPAQAEVLFGGQVEIRAQAAGRPVDKLWLVAQSGSNTTRAIMFLAPDKTFFQTLANLREPAEFFVTDGTARSRRCPIKIRYTPQITLVEVTTDFPAYTSKPSRTGKLADEPQALPVDTRVSFRVASNRPLRSGELQLTPVLGGATKHVPLAPETNSSIVTGALTLTNAVVFTLSVRDIGGLECAEPRRGRFNVSPDERPRLIVLEPGRDAVSTPAMRIPVAVRAEDDFGVGRVLWLRGHNRSIERPFQMKLTPQRGPQVVGAEGTFDLGSLGVRPGDVIDYYFEATDNFPRGPNVSLSRMYRLEVVSQEQYEQFLRQLAARKALFEPYFKLGAWLKRLAERARNAERQALAAASETEQAAAQKEAQSLADDLDKYHRDLGRLLQHPTMFDMEQAFRSALVEQHTRLAETRKKLRSAAAGAPPNTKQLSEASNELNELAEREEESVSEPARRIAAVAHLLARAGTFTRLAQAQASLAQMLRRFADRTNTLSRAEEMEVQELRDQQRRVQEGLSAMLASLPELLAKVPEEAEFEPLRADVNDFIKTVSDARIEPDMTDAVKALSEPDATTGYVLAQRAADKMDKLISRCQGMPQQGQQCLRFKPSLQQSFGNTLQQILAAMGMNEGQGGDGYGMFSDDVAVYGPAVELAGEQGEPRGDRGEGPGRRVARVEGDSRDPGLKGPDGPGRVRLQPDAKFPLRYRDLVGEYFRAIAEEGTEGGGKR
jgi:hypothetical protein